MSTFEALFYRGLRAVAVSMFDHIGGQHLFQILPTRIRQSKAISL